MDDLIIPVQYSIVTINATSSGIITISVENTIARSSAASNSATGTDKTSISKERTFQRERYLHIFLDAFITSRNVKI